MFCTLRQHYLVENNKQKELSLIYPVEFTHLLLSVMPIKDRKGNIQRIHANTTFVIIRRNVKIGLCEAELQLCGSDATSLPSELIISSYPI